METTAPAGEWEEEVPSLPGRKEIVSKALRYAKLSPTHANRCAVGAAISEFAQRGKFPKGMPGRKDKMARYAYNRWEAFIEFLTQTT